jgi:glycosyltransferase involved in cell wall biosynthesis
MIDDMKYGISVIISVYNSEKYLNRCIKNILLQTMKNLEIIIINDGSDGNCEHIALSYSKKFSNILYIKFNKNRSLIQARIAGARAASGKYITYLDVDDWLSISTCEDIFKLAEDKRADFVQFPRYEGDSELSMQPFLSHAYHDVELIDREILKDFLISNARLWSACGKMFLRETMLRALDFAKIPDDVHINNAEGFLIVFSVCCVAKKYICTESIGVYYCFFDYISMSRSVFNYPEKWNKFFSDLAIVQNITYTLLKEINVTSEEFEGWKRRREYAIRGYVKNMANIEQHQRSYYLKCLYQCVMHDTQIIFFDILRYVLCEDLCNKNKELSNIYSSRSWKIVQFLRSLKSFYR